MQKDIEAHKEEEEAKLNHQRRSVKPQFGGREIEDLFRKPLTG